MSIRRIFPLLAAATWVASLACGQQSSVRVDGGQGEEQVTLVIENTLSGIGRMISASSGSGDVQVRYDPDGATYHVRGTDGSTVEIDARTGRYAIRAARPDAVDATVEHSLAAVGSILRAISQSRVDTVQGVEAVLTETERDALDTVWRTQGLTQDQIDAYAEILRNANEIERYARQLERQIEGEERRIEADARQIERDAKQVERDARSIERHAERAGEAYRPTGHEEAVFSCGGSEELVLRGRTIDSEGVVIYAYGSCDVLIVGCEITSGSVAIRLEGNAEAEIRDSRIEGLVAAIELGGNADVEASDTEFIGELRQSGSAEFEDLGGNTFRK